MRAIAVLPVLFAILVGAPSAHAWTWPADGPVLEPFLFSRSDPYRGGQHRGVDVAGAAGAAVVAPAGGVVTFAGTVPGGGRTVTVTTPDGYAVTLVHLGSVTARRGAEVAEGAPLGTIGPSGDAEHAEPYVHLGVRIAAEPEGYVDPLAFLPPRASGGVAPTPGDAAPAPVPAPTPDPPASDEAEPEAPANAPAPAEPTAEEPQAETPTAETTPTAGDATPGATVPNEEDAGESRAGPGTPSAATPGAEVAVPSEVGAEADDPAAARLERAGKRRVVAEHEWEQAWRRRPATAPRGPRGGVEPLAAVGAVDPRVRPGRGADVADRRARVPTVAPGRVAAAALARAEQAIAAAARGPAPPHAEPAPPRARLSLPASLVVLATLLALGTAAWLAAGRRTTPTGEAADPAADVDAGERAPGGAAAETAGSDAAAPDLALADLPALAPLPMRAHVFGSPPRRSVHARGPRRPGGPSRRPPHRVTPPAPRGAPARRPRPSRALTESHAQSPRPRPAVPRPAAELGVGEESLERGPERYPARGRRVGRTLRQRRMAPPGTAVATVTA